MMIIYKDKIRFQGENWTIFPRPCSLKMKDKIFAVTNIIITGHMTRQADQKKFIRQMSGPMYTWLKDSILDSKKFMQGLKIVGLSPGLSMAVTCLTASSKIT